MLKPTALAVFVSLAMGLSGSILTAQELPEDGLQGFTPDLEALPSGFDIAHVSRTQMRLTPQDQSRDLTLNVQFSILPPQNFETRPFASAEFISHFQRYCDRLYVINGTCTFAPVSDAEFPRLQYRNAGDADRQVVLVAERWTGTMLVTTTAILAPGSDEDAAAMDLAAFTAQVDTFFSLPPLPFEDFPK